MSENPDRPLAGTPDLTENAGTDVSEPLAAEDLDFAAFTRGVRPTRRAVRIYPRGDLIGVMESIVDAIDQAGDGDVDHLIDEYESARDLYHSTSMLVVVEARSSEWVAQFRTVRAEQMGATVDWSDSDDADTKVVRHAILTEQLAAQIVTPQAVTADDLQFLIEQAEGEAGKLFAAMALANGQQSTAAKVLTLDFSQRRSRPRRRRRSPRRSK